MKHCFGSQESILEGLTDALEECLGTNSRTFGNRNRAQGAKPREPKAHSW